MNNVDMDILALRKRLDEGEITISQLCDEFSVNAADDAFVSLCDTNEMIAYAESRVAQHSVREWTGLPIALSDDIVMSGVKVSTPAGYIPPFDATVVGKLKRYGAIIVGKTRIDTSPCGSAYAVAAKRVVGALSSCAKGALIRGAAQCAVCAIKPTYGSVSRYGLITQHPSIDQIGVIARSVRDLGILLDSVTDYDPRDGTMFQPRSFGYCRGLNHPIAGMSVGVLAGQGSEVITEALTDCGVKVCAGELSLTDTFPPVDAIILPNSAYADSDAIITCADNNGLPIMTIPALNGVTLIGAAFGEETLLTLAYRLCKENAYHV